MDKTKVQTLSESAKKGGKKDLHYLDKLAQLGKLNDSKPLEPSESHKKYLKKARKKAIGYAMATELLKVESSPLLKSYKSTLFCSGILLQEGNSIRTKQCKQRWCNVCNGIRTADLINGYMPPLKQLGKLYMVTLTIRSVTAKDLKDTISTMGKKVRTIQHDRLRKVHGFTLTGIRKIECNYNASKDTYNPHIHFVIHADKACQLLLLKAEWLNAFPDDTEADAQDIRPADDDSLHELFKYATKPLTKGEFSAHAQDIIYTAFRGKRLIQNMGGLKKHKTDVERSPSDEIDFQPATNEIEIWGYEYQHKDWVTSKGAKFTGYRPDQKTKELLRIIEQPKNDFKRF